MSYSVCSVSNYHDPPFHITLEASLSLRGDVPLRSIRGRLSILLSEGDAFVTFSLVLFFPLSAATLTIHFMFSLRLAYFSESGSF